ncbi:metalloregulator ArsR/SmtB family transcription factor [Kribbella pittospori]|uniref:Metalloregulator ArsR/SmtB family transcription factor n=1 Tax=Kribbella pittospori TaxID=722689 RepID=A0A4R0K7I4_9ACTN|nr:metalloregulator ArsR/SmtB family transcription factor [Kribbella pittospori]TCC56101.1 metalloregulator ArsR/SmtB family transcription factor [Kribbella pittospori]
MDQIASALGDGARWRIVELLAERPRSVGELAELTGLRQPQTTKHLQTLGRAGLVTVTPLGQRRVYALEAAPLRSFERRLGELVGAIEAHAGDRVVIARHRASIDAESAIADRERWADGRTFSFERFLAVAPEVVWQHWVDPDLLANWWAPPSVTIADCILEPEPGGRAVLDYRDGEQLYRSRGHVHTADEASHLVFDLRLLDDSDAVSFHSEYDVRFAAVPEGTRLQVDVRINETTVDAVPYIAGIATGWGQVLDNLTNRINDKGADR